MRVDLFTNTEEDEILFDHNIEGSLLFLLVQPITLLVTRIRLFCEKKCLTHKREISAVARVQENGERKSFILDLHQ